MTQLKRLLCLVLSASMAVPAAAIPVSHGEEAPQAEAPQPISADFPTASVTALPPAAPAPDAAAAPSLLDSYGLAPSAAARDAAAAAAIRAERAAGTAGARSAAAAPAVGTPDEASAQSAALIGLPARAQERFKELFAAFGAPSSDPMAPLPFVTVRFEHLSGEAVRDMQALASKSGVSSKAVDDATVRLEAPMARLAAFMVRVEGLPGWSVSGPVAPKADALAPASRPAQAAVTKVNADPRSSAASPAAFSAGVLDKAAIAASRSKQGPILREVDGVSRPLGYNPELGVTPVWKELAAYLRHPIRRLRALRQYKRRVDQYMGELTDDDLSWSMQRFPEFEKQEGILRHSNRDLVNDWKKWGNGVLPLVSPADYDDALMSRISIRKIFKQAMDREEPTISYQATSAHELHDQMHNVAHFMGVTMQERVISVALTGNAPQESVWAAEEKRHGNIMERVYNFTRPKGWPELNEQGIAPTSPSRGARSMIANRALAEIGAGTGYLVLKSNAKKGSPADLALEGIFRDEVYHYVLMDAARKWGFGHPSNPLARAVDIARWSAQMLARAVGFKVEVRPPNQYYGTERLLNIVQHYNDNQLPDAIDSVIDERGGFSPVAIFQVAYAFFSIHRRVTRYLNTIPDDVGRRAIGNVYKSDAEFQAAVARGEHTRTETFTVEQNPDLTADEVRELVRRFPGRFSMDRRSIKESDIRGILANYRELLKRPSYWLRKKGFKDLGTFSDVEGLIPLHRTLEREFPGHAKVQVLFQPGTYLGPRQPVVQVYVMGEKIFDKSLDQMSMRQIGLIFADAAPDEAKKGLTPDITKVNEAGPDFTPAEIVQRLGAKKTYQAEPLTLIND